MIKFKAGDLIGFGLSEGNIQKLKEGKPIAINMQEMGIENMRIIIMYGKTEQDIQSELSDFIGPETKYSSTMDN